MPNAQGSVEWYGKLVQVSARRLFDVDTSVHAERVLYPFDVKLEHVITGPGLANSAGKQDSKPTCHAKEPLPVVTPRPQKKPIKLEEAATTAAPNVTTKYQDTENLGYEATVEDTSGENLTEYVPADHNEFLEAADAATATRKRYSTAFSSEHRDRDEPNTKRLKTAPWTVQLATTPIAEYKRAIDQFFKWRHRRLDLADEQFLDESKRGWQGENVDHARINFKKHYDLEVDMLKELEARCYAKLKVGSPHHLLVETFFERVTLTWMVFFNETINASGALSREDRAEVFEGKQRDRYRLFVSAEKAWVQCHLEFSFNQGFPVDDFALDRFSVDSREEDFRNNLKWNRGN